MSVRADVVAELTGPGGAFETTTEVVDGVEMTVYAERMGSLREVLQAASLRGDEEFVVHGDRRISFGEFATTANGISARLADLGVGHGDRVAVLSANNPEWCLTFWATVDLGAILVGLNGWWKTDEIVYGLQDSGAKVLVADRKRFERVAGHLDDVPDLEHVFLVDADPADVGGSSAGGPELKPFAELTADPTGDFSETDIAEGDPAVIFYTSGTTGRPKGAISTHRGMIANLQNTLFNTVSGLMVEAAEDPDAPPAADTRTTALLTSPLFHVSGTHSGLVVGTLGGIKLVIPEGRFDPDAVLQLIEEEQVTIWATVPTMVWRVCEHPGRHDYDTSSVGTVAFGGSPSAEELQRMIADTFPNVRSTSNAYGLTESSSVATVISGSDARAKPDSVGPPMPVVEIRIADADGAALGPHETGEVLIRGPIVMPGYWGKPEATADTVIDGWLHTGDVGHVDEDGYLFITDRAKDMIIRGGENIYCVEIEQRLVDHDAIADAAVIGVPHPELGEEVKAVVQQAPDATITEDEVKAWVADALAYFKVPEYVQITTDKLPRNASGKLLKNVLRGEGEVIYAETMEVCAYGSARGEGPEPAVRGHRPDAGARPLGRAEPAAPRRRPGLRRHPSHRRMGGRPPRRLPGSGGRHRRRRALRGMGRPVDRRRRTVRRSVDRVPAGRDSRLRRPRSSARPLLPRRLHRDDGADRRLRARRAGARGPPPRPLARRVVLGPRRPPHGPRAP
ncbi:MAG: class I adenylate-forming enzyme family protein, partial [Actinomycetota bacterium]